MTPDLATIASELAADMDGIASHCASIRDKLLSLIPPAPPPPPPAPKTSLPILTDARLAAFRAMQQANSPAWQAFKAIADASLTQPDPNEPGWAPLVLWKLTGHATYLTAAWSRVLGFAQIPTGAPYDSVSDSIVEAAVVYGCLKGSGTPGQEAQAVAQLTAFAQVAIGTSTTVNGGMPPSNANYTIPLYFGCALLDALGVPGDWLKQTSNQSGLVMPVGGLDSTAADRSTARNCVRQYFEVLSAGGTWCELPYEDKSLPRAILGWMALYDLLGVDHFPEIAAWVLQRCDAALVDYAWDGKGFYPCGDRTRLDDDYQRMLANYAALQAAALEIGDQKRAENVGYVAQVTLTLARPPINDVHYWFFYDPANGRGTRPADPLANDSPGIGLYRRADGNDLFAAFWPSTIDLNHEQACGDFFLWSGGENALGRPYGYALQLAGIDIPGATGNVYGTNGLAFCGLSKMQQSASFPAVTAPDYSFGGGTTGGLIYGKGGNLPDVEWLHEGTRTWLYLPASHTLFVCDRVNADDPRVGFDLSKYSLPHRQAIQAAANLTEQIWHCQTKPNEIAGAKLVTLSWATDGGQHCELDAWSPMGGVVADIVDESVLWAGVSAIDADQKRWQFRLHPDATRQWNVILSCWRLNPGADVPLPLTQANAAGFQLGSTAVLFSIDPATRLLDPATAAAAGASKTYLVGCSGNQSVVVK